MGIHGSRRRVWLVTGENVGRARERKSLEYTLIFLVDSHTRSFEHFALFLFSRAFPGGSVGTWSQLCAIEQRARASYAIETFLSLVVHTEESKNG